MSDTFKYLKNSNSNDEPAQEFLKKYTDRYTPEQQARLDANGGPSHLTDTKYNPVVLNQEEVDAFTEVTGGGTERWQDYENSNNGDIAFTDSWQDGAKRQQLLGSGSLSNESFNEQFASAKGGADTGTLADDGGGWKLIKQDQGEKTNERKLEYKDIAEQWQKAGYDVRVQDHNPDFEGGTGEIAVRVSGKKSNAPKPEIEDVAIEHSPEIQQAKERVATYENDVMSGKITDDIYKFDATKGAEGIGTPLSGDSGNQAEQATKSFLANKSQEIKKNNYKFKPK